MTTTGELPSVVDDVTRARLPVSAGMLDLQVQPSIAAGRRRVQFAAAVTNSGAGAVEARLSAGGADEAVVAAITPSRLLLEPGQTRTVDVTLSVRRPRFAGGELSHTVAVRARGDNAGGAVARDVVFVQQRALPAWALVLGVVLVAAAAVAATQIPDRVEVPRVQGAPDVATAARTLRAAGLEVDPQLRSRTARDVRPGTILDQIPGAGMRVSRGDRVTLLVALGSGRTVTPQLGGATPGRAAALLQAAGLTLGPILPAEAPAGAVVGSQLPAAGTRVAAGTAVTLVVRAAGGVATAGGAGAAAAGSGRATVPPIGDRTANAYVRAVASAGLVPRVVRTISSQPLGTVLSVSPQSGLELGAGEVVRVRVAAGVPALTFDTGAVVRVFDLRSGRSAREAAPPQGNAVEPSWSSDGRRLLYRVGRRLLLVSAGLADRGRVVYDGRTRYAAATLAPAPSDGAVALVRRTGGDGDLCFGTIGQGQLRPRCQADRRWDLGRQISWHRNGRELLVFGVRRNNPEKFGMLVYRSSKPFSTNPRDWRGAMATDTSAAGRGVIAAAYSPAGTNVALVTNVGLPRFQVRLTTPGSLRDPSAPPLPVRACEVAWRPDGGELAVVQSDGACSRPLGQIVRVDPQAPRRTTSVTSGGRHPSYQPLTYAGPRGLS
ncbi:MAG: PASTA domain-containing protein [Solirubrobacteraceae bacterium]|nr:PASTA domain-containing protein [Solirubrobacteraceae bacterium]